MQKVLAATKLEEQDLRDLKEIADKKQRTVSDLMRIIIKDFIRQQKI